jgi:hypothetical protein
MIGAKVEHGRKRRTLGREPRLPRPRSAPLWS